ncbi:hypothetical protein [Macrococcoides caseolyticum]|uniref:hypothetical protein n=1 Tax=Macrococcoides caseolyticum TaxID=69966 RepID=UPI001F256849|nr:hypothetical protein [Macrococcus caseolyticus]MCE4956639.1 hypothetical protein [Macrococcus caseolyticus]
MREKARYIIDTIDQLAHVTKGGKRAHAEGFNYKGKVRLNERGKSLLGNCSEAIVRLSDTLPDKEHSTRFVPLKGMAIHFESTIPTNIVLISFPYFPWNKADFIVKLAQYCRAISKERDIRIKLNLLRYLLQIESLHKHLPKLIVNQPVIPSFKNKKYYNLHYLKHNEKGYIRFQTIIKDNIIELKAEIHDYAKSLDIITDDYVLVEIGTIELTNPMQEVIESFEVLQTGEYLKPLEDDEIIHLRSALYDISHQRRVSEGIVYDNKKELENF